MGFTKPVIQNYSLYETDSELRSAVYKTETMIQPD